MMLSGIIYLIALSLLRHRSTISSKNVLLFEHIIRLSAFNMEKLLSLRCFYSTYYKTLQ